MTIIFDPNIERIQKNVATLYPQRIEELKNRFLISHPISISIMPM